MDEKDEEVKLENTPEQEEKEKPESKPEKKKKEESIDVEALKKALREEITEAVRKEEKDKLYKSFEKYKEDARLAEEARKAAEEKLREYEMSKLSAEEQEQLRLKELEESNNRLQQQMQELVEAANSKITNLQLELAKKDILSRYGDEIIASLVTGTTVEELAESAEKAHAEYVAIRDKELAKLRESKQKDKIGTGIAPQNDGLNTGATIADIKNVKDPKVWEANRERFLKEALKHI